MIPARRLALAAVLAGAALAPVPAAQGAARWHAAGSRFPAPAVPMRLVREWRRDLPDGQQIVSRRTYAVHFVAEGDGFRLDGRLLSVEVEAPAKLAALARIEQARPDAGLFPIRLDAHGAIAGATGLAHAPSRAEAGAVVAGMLDRLRDARAEHDEGSTFVQQWQASAPAAHWPADLFRPEPGERRETRTIALPDGEMGAIEVVTAAQCDGTSGLLARFERTVVTRSGGQQRTTRERWELVPDTSGG